MDSNTPEWAKELVKVQTSLVETIKALSDKVTSLEKENNTMKESLKEVVPEKIEQATQEEVNEIFDHIQLI